MRDIIEQAAREAGVPPEKLTTMADLFSGPRGLPDRAPYNETVVLASHVSREDPDASRWDAYLWHKARKSGTTRPTRRSP